MYPGTYADLMRRYTWVYLEDHQAYLNAIWERTIERRHAIQNELQQPGEYTRGWGPSGPVQSGAFYSQYEEIFKAQEELAKEAMVKMVDDLEDEDSDTETVTGGVPLNSGSLKGFKRQS